MKNQKKSSGAVRALPDDVVMEILSRLPADYVSKSRRVCRHWKALISSKYFANMHMKHSSFLMILVQERLYSPRPELFLVDKWEPPRKKTRSRKLCLNSILSPDSDSYSFHLSHDGLIVISCYLFNDKPFEDFIIFNPITRDKVAIITPNHEGVDIWGMFFHPLIGEYCLVWRQVGTGLKGHFKMLNLGPQPFCKDLKAPACLLHQHRFYCTAPVVIDEDATLYWMVICGSSHGMHPPREMIMALDIKEEELTLMPHPGPADGYNDSKHLDMHILKMDGRLSFVRNTTTTNAFIIDVWTLKDSAARLWIKSHSVSISIDQLVNIGGPRVGNFEAMAFGSGELLLRYSYTERVCPDDSNLGMHRYGACNLELGTVRRIGRTYRESYMSTYVPSFVSLRNCKSEIWI